MKIKKTIKGAFRIIPETKEEAEFAKELFEEGSGAILEYIHKNYTERNRSLLEFIEEGD